MSNSVVYLPQKICIMMKIQGRYLLCAAWAVLFTQAISAQPCKLMTYNIRLDVASDGPNAWEHRRSFLMDQIRFYDPDIFGIQEGLPHQVKQMQEGLADYDSEGAGREGKGKGESTHVFFKRAKYALEKSQTFWLSPTPDVVSMGWDAACLRVCTAVLLWDKKTKRRFWIFNTHLDHMGEQARANSVELILEKIKSFNPRQWPVIFMGDLNATPDSPVISKLKSVMNDSRSVSQAAPFGPDGTFNGFEFDEPVTQLIDYIFVSKTPKLTVRKYAVLSDSRNLRYPSDHLPVFVEIDFGKQAKYLDFNRKSKI